MSTPMEIVDSAGTLGDFLLFFGRGEPEVAPRIRDLSSWPPLHGDADPVREANPAPGLRLWWRGAVQLDPSARGGLALSLQPGGSAGRANARKGVAAQLSAWHASAQTPNPMQLAGRFALVTWDAQSRRLQVFTDPFKTCPIYWARTAEGMWLASDLRLIARTGAVSTELSRTAIYQYLNFSCIPVPLTPLKSVFKLAAGGCLQVNDGACSTSIWWDAEYPEDLAGSETDRADQLRQHIESTVREYRCRPDGAWGAFLSGGTDSSSICSVLSKAHSSPVKSFSIGFDEQGYDELAYARIASQAFGLQAFEHRVGEDEAVNVISALSRGFDEPFGNASAIPTHACAQLAARNGVKHLVAGDGGDEIFGGNERYRKDAIFDHFHRAPAPVRWLGSGAAAALQGVDTRWANRVKNFVRRGSMPNPDRFYSDDAFASVHFDSLLTPSFTQGLGVDDALDVQRRLFGQVRASSELNRLMYIDLKMAIADNDVVKVVRASKLAGVDISFPYLDRRLVDFTGRLPAHDKLRGRHKRYLFKKATLDLLPEAIRSKRKQGFGLPISVWLRGNGRYRELVHDVVLSQQAQGRDIFSPAFVRGLIEHHQQDAWDHAAEVHQILMLELWHRQVVDGHG